MGKHLSVEPEIRGFEAMMRILENHRQRAGRDMYRESARNLVDYLHDCALRGTCDYQFADGAERAFTAVMQSLPLRGGPTPVGADAEQQQATGDDESAPLNSDC